MRSIYHKELPLETRIAALCGLTKDILKIQTLIPATLLHCNGVIQSTTHTCESRVTANQHWHGVLQVGCKVLIITQASYSYTAWIVQWPGQEKSFQKKKKNASSSYLVQ